MTNEQFWELVDEYENGEISYGDLTDMCILYNKGNLDEAKEDVELITAKDRQ